MRDGANGSRNKKGEEILIISPGVVDSIETGANFFR